MSEISPDLGHLSPTIGNMVGVGLGIEAGHRGVGLGWHDGKGLWNCVGPWVRRLLSQTCVHFDFLATPSHTWLQTG